MREARVDVLVVLWERWGGHKRRGRVQLNDEYVPVLVWNLDNGHDVRCCCCWCVSLRSSVRYVVGLPFPNLVRRKKKSWTINVG